MKRIGIGILLLAATAALPYDPKIKRIEGRDAELATWYHELEQCSGLKGDFYGVTFYTTTEHLHNGRTFDGYWEPGSIVVRHSWDKLAIQHEIMHDLTASIKHPKEYFDGRCGDLTRGEAF